MLKIALVAGVAAFVSIARILGRAISGASADSGDAGGDWDCGGWGDGDCGGD